MILPKSNRWPQAPDPGRVLPLALALVLAGCGHHDVIPPRRLHSEAILVLPGIGMRSRDTHRTRQFAGEASARGYDLYLADYRSRGSVREGVANLGHFIRENRLDRYHKVHVFAMIMGGVTLNHYLRDHPTPNLASIVFDRSPLQERAPEIASTGSMAVPVRVLLGPVVADLAAVDKPEFRDPGVRVGLMIEGRATALIRMNKRRALAMGPVDFSRDSFNQRCDDHVYLWLDHLEMYGSYDQIGPELLHFFDHGRFSGQARREPFDRDAFSRR